MNATCSCCGGATVCSGQRMLNRPGLGRIAYRAGTHASFLERMMARLSNQDFPQLAALKRRDSGDASVALLDAWAVAADVLSFYNERIANEAYLRTATERRSVLELARLTGYRLRPGVAASVYLAYELEKDALPLTLPAGTRSQSVPGPGETMQTFETAEALEARAAWNTLQPRKSQPQVRTPGTVVSDGIYLQGVATALKQNDALLVVFDSTGEDGDPAGPHPFVVDSIEPDAAADRTLVRLRTWGKERQLAPPPQLLASHVAGNDGEPIVAGPDDARNQRRFLTFIRNLNLTPTPQPSNALRLARNPALAFTAGADVFPQLLQSFNPVFGTSLYTALANAPLTGQVPFKVYALRARAALFAHNAPNQPVIERERANLALLVEPTIKNTWGDLVGEAKSLQRVALDRVYDQVKPSADSYVLIDRPALREPDAEGGKIDPHFGVHRVAEAATRTMATAIGAALDVTLLTLDPRSGPNVEGAWLAADIKPDFFGHVIDDSALLRGTRVFAQSEQLALAEEPISAALGDDGDQPGEIELDALYDGLKPGRWLTIAGERSDVDGIGQIGGAELVMLAAVRHGLQQIDKEKSPSVPAQYRPGDRIHTFITLAEKLVYRYKRATVAFNANVVRATHGETRREVAGGGDPAWPFQQFGLRQAPLTYVAAPTTAGVASTLAMWVNDVRWPEVRSLLELAPEARGYVSRRDDEEHTSVIFGDGKHGARLPGGADNIRATYRSGIGKGGNVAPGQITLATDKPLGVKGLRNPLRASGGAGPDNLEQARQNAPLAVMALDRLVSVQDYADFSRLFAGIGKASAMLEPGTRNQSVCVTIAGIDDIPIDPSSDLFRNLVEALHRFGDPQLPLKVGVREALALVISAKVALRPEYAWETVAPKVRAALYDSFGFARRELGQEIATSAVISTIQQVDGVAYAMVKVKAYESMALLDGLIEGDKDLAAAPCSDARLPVGPTQIAFLAPDVPDSLILELL